MYIYVCTYVYILYIYIYVTLLAISAINFYPQEHQSHLYINKIILLFMNIIYTLIKRLIFVTKCVNITYCSSSFFTPVS